MDINDYKDLSLHDFKQKINFYTNFKNDKYKIIAIFAKLARGLMARYIIDTDAKTLDDIKGFNYENYGFSEELSSENELVFTR